jgi:pimeloyl-ACP methyl ester carboxylesterase
MQILFVHGMARSPLSGWPMRWKLQRAGWRLHTFGYIAAVENFDAITARLALRVQALAADGDYALVGHSLGGVLLRETLKRLPADTRPARRLFLLGSPIQPSRIAQSAQRNLLYRATTGDCGQLLASTERMAAVGEPAVPTTGIVGIRSWSGPRGPFGSEANDSIVSVSEVSSDWLTDQVRVQVVHTLLPYSAQVADIILQRLGTAPAGR